MTFSFPRNAVDDSIFRFELEFQPELIPKRLGRLAREGSHHVLRILPCAVLLILTAWLQTWLVQHSGHHLPLVSFAALAMAFWRPGPTAVSMAVAAGLLRGAVCLAPLWASCWSVLVAVLLLMLVLRAFRDDAPMVIFVAGAGAAFLVELTDLAIAMFSAPIDVALGTVLGTSFVLAIVQGTVLTVASECRILSTPQAPGTRGFLGRMPT